MRWGYLLLVLMGCFAATISFYLHYKTERLKYLGLLTASFFFVIVDIALILAPVFTGSIGAIIIKLTVEWGHLFCLTSILSTLLLFIRESKPEFSKFPLFYVLFPVIIILSYFLVHNTLVLKKWLMQLYQGGAVLVAVMMYGIYYYRESSYKYTFLGSATFLGTFLFYIILPRSYNWIWQVSLALSIGLMFGGYYKIEQYKQQLVYTKP